jgi:hypothetical protein
MGKSRTDRGDGPGADSRERSSRSPELAVMEWGKGRRVIADRAGDRRPIDAWRRCGGRGAARWFPQRARGTPFAAVAASRMYLHRVFSAVAKVSESTGVTRERTHESPIGRGL